MNPSERFSSPVSGDSQIAPTQNISLIAIDEVLHQDDLELLKQQLAIAHQLLNYQQGVVNSLTERVNLSDARLLKSEQQVAQLQRQCEAQQSDLMEVQSICSDLRVQLRRQQRKPDVMPSRPTIAAPDKSCPMFEIQQRVVAHRQETVSFGYESLGPSQGSSLTKAPPVKVWSASQGGVHREELTFCQKLTTLVVSSTSTVSAFTSQQTEVERRKDPIRQSGYPSTSIELPRFAMQS